MSSSEMQSSSDLLYTAIFQQIQDCGDIISSILLVVKFIQENNISVGFDVSKLRHIALRTVDNETNTYLWHINALVAASSDFEHLLLGIEMMFDRFLGNRMCFMKEKEKQQKEMKSKPSNASKTGVSSIVVTPATTKFLGNEIVSFVNSYYDEQGDSDVDKGCPTTETGLAVVTEDVATNVPNENSNTNDENRNSQNAGKLKVEENEEFMQKYRGKISSPISFRMRQQKRMMQSERRGSEANSRNVSMLDFGDSELDIQSLAQESFVEPEISSPFNVNKFAQAVDCIQETEMLESTV